MQYIDSFSVKLQLHLIRRNLSNIANLRN